MKNDEIILDVKYKITITEHDIANIMNLISKGASNHWCSEVKAIRNCSDKKMDMQISKNCQVVLYDFIAKQHLYLNKDKILNGLQMFLSDGNFHCLSNGYKLDISRINTADADCIIQYALFDELMYR